jgi:hypothetical protein
MRNTLAILVAIFLFIAWWTPAQAQGQTALAVISRTMAWAQFLEKMERWQGGGAISPHNIDDDPQPDIIRVIYQSKTPVSPFNLHNALMGLVWFTMHDYRRSAGIPAFIIMKETTEMQGGSHTGMKFQFWKGTADQFTLMSEIRVRVTEFPVDVLKQIWADDSPEMLAFHQWLDSLGNAKRVRFRFSYFHSSKTGSIAFRETRIVPLAP